VVLGLTGQSVLLAHSPETLEFIRLRNTYLDPLHRLQAELLARSRNREAALDSPLEQALLVTVAGIAPGCAIPAEGAQPCCGRQAISADREPEGWLRRAQPGLTGLRRTLSPLGRLSGGRGCVS
jgi:hypothetical protein